MFLTFKAKQCEEEAHWIDTRFLHGMLELHDGKSKFFVQQRCNFFFSFTIEESFSNARGTNR